MKKLISFVMATVLCLGMTTAVMASPSAGTGNTSPDVDNTVVAPTPAEKPTISADAEVKVETVIDEATGVEVPVVYVNGELVTALPDGTPVNVDVKEVEEVKASYTEKQKTELAKFETMTEAEVLELVQDYVTEATNKTIDSSAVIVKDVECNLDNVTMSVFVEGVEAGKSYAVLHLKDDGTWESLAAKCEKNDYLKITFTTFSPIVITELLNIAQPVNPPQQGGAPIVTPSTPVAPKTADVAMFGMVAMAALAGTVTAARKAKESK